MRDKVIKLAVVGGWAAALVTGCSSIPSIGPDYAEPAFEVPDYLLPDAGQPTTNLTATGEYVPADGTDDRRGRGEPQPSRNDRVLGHGRVRRVRHPAGAGALCALPDVARARQALLLVRVGDGCPQARAEGEESELEAWSLELGAWSLELRAKS